MKIEIDYNGSLVSCKINGKPFNECDNIEKAQAMDSFDIITKNYYRTKSRK